MIIRIALSFLSALTAFALVMTITSENAQASRARLRALGQDPNGSLVIDDYRSTFQNPAQLSKFGQFANFELGSATVATTAPQAEGGLFMTRGDLHYGLQLGRAPMINTLISRTNANSLATGTRPYPQNVFEAVLSGGHSMKWGASLLYANSENRSETINGNTAYPNYKAGTMEAHGGIAQDKLSAYGKLLLFGSSEHEASAASLSKLDAKPSLEAGGNFDLNADQRIWGRLGLQMFSYRQTTNATDLDGNYNFLSAGFTQYLSPETATRLYMNSGLTYDYFVLKAPSGGTDSKTESYYIPVEIGLENLASDWLTLRASVTQRVLLDQKKTSVTNNSPTNTTTVAAGTSFKWKRFTIDSVLEGSTGVTPDAGGSVTGTAGTPGSFNGNTLFGHLGATYIF